VVDSEALEGRFQMNRHATPTPLHGADDSDALVSEFVENWRSLEGDAWIVRGGRDEIRRAIGVAILTMIGGAGPGGSRRVLAWATADLASLGLPGLLGEQGCEYVAWPSGPDREADEAGAGAAAPGAAELLAVAAASDLGITTCSWAVAETGTIALYATPSTGRLPSLLPTAHLALVRRSQIVKSIGDGLRLLVEHNVRDDTLPSAVNLVSGPSRSADIEGDLAVGVHGPRRAGVIVGDW
jgi:L-lactate dehydrogenase complex protein LldG